MRIKRKLQKEKNNNEGKCKQRRKVRELKDIKKKNQIEIDKIKE